MSRIIIPIRLNKHVIVECGLVILPGVDIGTGSSVGAMTLCTKSLGAWGIYAGIPAKRMKERSKKTVGTGRTVPRIADAARTMGEETTF